MTLVAGEGGIKEGVDNLYGKSRPYDSCAEGENIRIVVKPCHLS